MTTRFSVSSFSEVMSNPSMRSLSSQSAVSMLSFGSVM